MPGQNKYKPVRLRSHICERLSSPNSACASNSLARYFWVLDINLPSLSNSEFNLLCDACNGWASNLEEPDLAVSGLAIQVKDAIAFRSLDKKWLVNGDDLVQRIEEMSALAALSLLEKIESFWAQEEAFL
jgi:hypothetical protein